MSSNTSIGTLFTTFSTNLTTAGGIAYRVDSLADAVVSIDTIVGDTAAGRIWTSSRITAEQPRLAAALQSAGYELCVPTDPQAVRDQPVGLTVARLGIAETGSLLLHEPDVADRSVSLMTDLLIVVCPLDALVPSLDEAAGVLRDISQNGSSYATFVTGPSRTADIERQLTIGVQGPAAMHVIFLP